MTDQPLTPHELLDAAQQARVTLEAAAARAYSATPYVSAKIVLESNLPDGRPLPIGLDLYVAKWGGKSPISMAVYSVTTDTQIREAVDAMTDLLEVWGELNRTQPSIPSLGSSDSHSSGTTNIRRRATHLRLLAERTAAGVTKLTV